MRVFRYTLVADGSSDRCLLPIIDSVLDKLIPNPAFDGFSHQFARPMSGGQLADSIRRATSDFPCDVLFIHRDSERVTLEERRTEIETAMLSRSGLRYVPVVPVRMTETWLLIDEPAIRAAADNPNGKVTLALPRVAELERVADPKELLFELLIQASEKNGRRLQQFKAKATLEARRVRVANLIRDFTPLGKLTAFVEFSRTATEVVTNTV